MSLRFFFVGIHKSISIKTTCVVVKTIIEDVSFDTLQIPNQRPQRKL